jgi:TonB-linked SusC/RagA family outer membrane protein
MTRKNSLMLRLLLPAIFIFYLLPVTVAAHQSAGKISIRSNAITIANVFKAVKKQTGLTVFYSNTLLNDTEKISVDFNQSDLGDVMSYILKGRSLGWLLKGKNIVLQKEKPSSDPEAVELQSNNARQETISGTVKIAGNKDGGLSGVGVAVKGGKQAVATNASGFYRITNVPSNATLVFTYVGFETAEVKINGRTQINVELKENYSDLDEVVVVGYGAQKKRDLTGSIGSISADQMDRFPSGNLNTSLQGKIAGLQITINSGEPAAGATVRIRGASSISGGNQPLYIVDGMPINVQTFSASDDAGATFSPLSDINPADIESIEVLKDGAAASIYGSRATNGVVIITTKGGKGVKEPEINLSINSSLVDISRRVGVLNGPQWRDAYKEGYYNLTGSLTDKVSVIDSLHPYYSQSNNWQDIMFRESLQYKADVSVRGTSDKISYFASMGYADLKPVIIKTGYKQLTGNVNLDYKISDRITGKTTVKLSKSDYSRIKTGSSNFSVIFQSFSTMPVYAPYDPYSGEIIALFEGSKRNPLAIATYATNDIARWRMLGRQELNVKIFDGLSFQTSFGVDYDNTELSSYNPPILNTNESSNRSLLNPVTTDSWINENILNYKKTIGGNHNISALVGQSYQKFNRKSLNLSGSGSIDNLITSINGASTILNFSQGISENKLLSYFGRVNYDYKSRYLVSFTMRQDGSSRFGKDNRFGYFPAVSAGWRFTDETFFKGLDFLKDGKLRASYGVTGNQDIGNYVSQGSISNIGTYLGAIAIGTNAVPNQLLKWENTEQADVGLDLTFFNGRMDVMFDLYHKKTNDLLFNVQVPSEIGYNSIAMNYGSILNKGLEFTVGGVIVDKAFRWNSRLIFGMNRNEVIDLPDGRDYRPNSYSLARVGQPIGVFYGLKALGVYARDEDNVYRTENGVNIPYRKGASTGVIYKGGDVRWEDINVDGIINDDDLQIIGNPNPKFSGGFNNEFSWKRFKLNTFFTYSVGNSVFNLVKSILDESINDSNFSTDQLRRWRKQGDITDIPRLVKSDPMENNAVSSRFVEDGSFIRLQNLGIGYSVPAKKLAALKIKALDIGINAANLFIWSKYSGFDPEVSSTSSPLGYGADDGSFPKTTSYNFSLNVKF